MQAATAALRQLLVLGCLLGFIAGTAEAAEPSDELIAWGSEWQFFVHSTPSGKPPLVDDSAPSEKPPRVDDSGPLPEQSPSLTPSLGKAPFSTLLPQGKDAKSKKKGALTGRLEPSQLVAWSAKAAQAPVALPAQALRFEHSFALAQGTSYASLAVELSFVGPFVVLLNEQELLRHGLDLEQRFVDTRPERRLGEFVSDQAKGSRRRVFLCLPSTALQEGSNRLSVLSWAQPDSEPPALSFDLQLRGHRSATLLKGPYLQKLDSERVAILFETSSAAIPYVDFGAGETLDQSATTASSGGCLHEVLLTGLQPDTRYFYRVRAELPWSAGGKQARLESEIYHFRTAPHGPQDFSFLAYGDSRSAPKVHRALAQRMRGGDDAFVIHTGDLVGRGSVWEQWSREFFEPASALLPYLPYWLTPGNHEENHLNYFELFAMPGNEAYYSFRWGSAEFFSLNSYLSLLPGSKQYEWFANTVAQSEATWKIVFFHVPAYSCVKARLPGDRSAREHVQPLAEQHGVQLVLVGHDHLYGRAELNGVVHLIIGGGGAPPYEPTIEPPMLRCEKVHHFLRVRVSEASLLLEVLDLDGAEVDVFEIRR